MYFAHSTQNPDKSDWQPLPSREWGLKNFQPDLFHGPSPIRRAAGIEHWWRAGSVSRTFLGYE